MKTFKVEVTEIADAVTMDDAIAQAISRNPFANQIRCVEINTRGFLAMTKEELATGEIAIIDQIGEVKTVNPRYNPKLETGLKNLVREANGEPTTHDAEMIRKLERFNQTLHSDHESVSPAEVEQIIREMNQHNSTARLIALGQMIARKVKK